MENFTPFSAIIGGGLIGLSAVWLMASIGRIAGISGIVGGVLAAPRNDIAWRIVFVLGLIIGPLVVGLFRPDMLSADFPVTGALLILAGLLVGFGTQMGNGCTSGHGVCGISRLSMRSIVATFVFMITAMFTVYILRHVLGTGQ